MLFIVIDVVIFQTEARTTKKSKNQMKEKSFQLKRNKNPFHSSVIDMRIMCDEGS